MLALLFCVQFDLQISQLNMKVVNGKSKWHTDIYDILLNSNYAIYNTTSD